MRDEADQVDSFFSKVDMTEPAGCWIWMAARDANGYGSFKRNGRSVLAHRFAYEMENGSIPPGKVVRHTCDMRECCNPAHLVLGSHADNVADRVARNRSARGSNNGRAKVNERIVEIIRASPASDLEVAVRLKLSIYTVRNIRRGRSWRHVSMGSVWEG